MLLKVGKWTVISSAKNYQNSLKRALLRRNKLHCPRIIWSNRYKKLANIFTTFQSNKPTNIATKAIESNTSATWNTLQHLQQVYFRTSRYTLYKVGCKHVRCLAVGFSLSKASPSRPTTWRDLLQKKLFSCDWSTGFMPLPINWWRWLLFVTCSYFVVHALSLLWLWIRSLEPSEKKNDSWAPVVALYWKQTPPRISGLFVVIFLVFSF